MDSPIGAAIGTAVAFFIVCLLTFGCSTDTEEPTFSNPFDPALGEGLPIPDSVGVEVGDNLVRLTWKLPAGDTAEEYAIFRKRIDFEEDDEDERLLDRVTAPLFTDSRVRNGRSYAYRIAAGINGKFGRRTDEIEARPGLFTILISDGERVTQSRSIQLSFTVPDAEALHLSESLDSFPTTWQPAAASAPWTLSHGDGTKTVYARFRLSDGSETLPVFDTIDLDTKAVILSVSFDGSEVRGPGDTVHFRIDSGESQGTATITIAEIFDDVPLFDDGTSGDLLADDGIYERDLTIPPMAATNEQEIRGDFTDEAGNTATSMTAARLLTVRESPEPVELFEALISEPPDPPSATLRWRATLDTGFEAYRLYRSETALVDSTDRLLATETSATTTEFADSDVTESVTYFYRVYSASSLGQSTGSNTIRADIPNLRFPSPVTLETPNAISQTEIALDWSKSEDRDFSSYEIYRNDDGAVTDSDPLLGTILDIDQTFWDDTGLRENTTYYYRVYTIDQGALRSRSNELEVTTRNDPPPAVVLSEPADVDTTAATLSWDESVVHDFAFYRLYRDEIPTVTPNSTLVVEMDDAAFTSFREMDLLPGTRYYYRVFVVDDATDPESKGSNTVSVTMAELDEVPR